jgi:geranylgeranyl transferase type-2 subunit beta
LEGHLAKIARDHEPAVSPDADTSVVFRSAKERGFRGAKGDTPTDIHSPVLSPGGHAGSVDAGGTPDPLRFTEWLYGQLLPSGGFSRFFHDRRASAYHTFLGALCFQMLGGEMPAAEDAVAALAALSRPDGGYAELAGQTASQTSATAAAAAFLLMHDALSEDDAAKTARFLVNVQSPDGGLKPHAAVRGGDLLSTFTGLLTLWGLGGMESIDVAGVARFLRSAAHPAGGFLACEGDQSPDVEYTYYGIATLALLRQWNQSQ